MKNINNKKICTAGFNGGHFPGAPGKSIKYWWVAATNILPGYP